MIAAIDNSHICAEAAFDDVCNKLIQLFSSMDNPDMQQRVTDIQDMRERMIQILQGTKAFDLTNLPDNTVIVADAHQYLLDHYSEFDFIWTSPPCQTHSRANYFINYIIL